MYDVSKFKLRRVAKRKRSKVTAGDAKAVELIRRFPAKDFQKARFAGVWPLHDEIDLRPLMRALFAQGEQLCLPVTGPSGTALSFCNWTPKTLLRRGRFGTMEPVDQSVKVQPGFIFVPLLAFTSRGARLGYGGGFYDRTIAHIRTQHDVFACGVGFDAQETDHIPMKPHDVWLDAILTPSGFKRI